MQLLSKILIVFGTRPEAIKLAPVVKELKRYPEKAETIVCITSQHRDLLDQVLHVFNIQPDYDLDIMTHGQTLADVTSRVLYSMKTIYAETNPDIVLVQGDTTTAFSAALSAYYHQIPVGHVEAGLRTGDKYQPFPEEINRRLTGVLADLHFAPTERARENLLREAVPSENITVTGNTVIDALLEVSKREFQFNDPILSGLSDDHTIFITAHRRESFGQLLQNICRAIRILAERYPDFTFVYPVHPNPKVRDVVYLLLDNIANILLTEPLEYVPFVHLMKRSRLILTDSGGIQEEAPSLNKPVLVLRDVTERPEAVETGAVRLVGTQTETIVTETIRLLENQEEYEQMAKASNPFGDGQAAKRIVKTVLQSFQNQRFNNVIYDT